MKLNEKNVLLFDLDGTLVDSAPDLALALNRTLKDLNKAQYDEKIIRRWIGTGAKVLVEHALSASLIEHESLQPALVNDALSIFLQHYQNCLCINSRLYDDVKEGLSLLKNAGFRLAIITNKIEVFTLPILVELGIDELFDIVISGDTLVNKKPDPAQLYYALAQLNVLAEQCVMIGDSKNDILAAKAANISSVGLTYGYNYGEDIQNYQPQWCFDTFAELIAALKR
ncbi:phosphoglycolate phosphatase [Colwelliaceae bacterium MEBiC 14330]